MKKTQVQNAKGEVRIIAGLWRGRKLPVLNAEGLRPTGDRVKETLFNWLMPYIHDARCLEARFDVIFLDPPFHFDLAQRAIELLAGNNWLRPNALIYVETERDKMLVTPKNWTLLKEKNTGMVSYRLYRN